MIKDEVIKLLEKNKNPRGIANWEKLGTATNGLRSFGLGMTQLKKLAKQIGKDHKLALELWQMPCWDTKILATIIDNPKEITRQQVDVQVKEAKHWMMSYSFTSNLMSRVPFVKEKAVEWAASNDDTVRRCGYALIYEIANDDKTLGDSFFEPYLEKIEKHLQKEENFVKDAMNSALFAIGKRNKKLNKKALEIAKKIGKVEVDYGDNSCQAIDVVKHLTGDYVKKKIAKT